MCNFRTFSGDLNLINNSAHPSALGDASDLISRIKELHSSRARKDRAIAAFTCSVLAELQAPNTGSKSAHLVADASRMAIFGAAHQERAFGIGLLSKITSTDFLAIRVLRMIALDERRPLTERIYAQASVSAEQLGIIPKLVFDLASIIAKPSCPEQKAFAARELDAHLDHSRGILRGPLADLLQKLHLSTFNSDTLQNFLRAIVTDDSIIDRIAATSSRREFDLKIKAYRVLKYA